MVIIDPSILRAGDILLYRPHSFFGWIIAFKTWCREASHVEVYMGQDKSSASRDGIGVGMYELRLKDLSMVLRPRTPFDMDKALAYYETVKGQPYDWRGVWCFSLMAERGEEGKQICSEYARNLQTSAGPEWFATEWPSDKVAPAQFVQSKEGRRIA